MACWRGLADWPHWESAHNGNSTHKQKPLTLSLTLLLVAMKPRSQLWQGFWEAAISSKEAGLETDRIPSAQHDAFSSNLVESLFSVSAFLGFRLQIGWGKEQCHIRWMHTVRCEIKFKKEIFLGKKKIWRLYWHYPSTNIISIFFPIFLSTSLQCQHMIILYI